MIASLSKKEWVFIVLLFVMFLAFRLPGVHIPYHQDEYKWVMYAHPEILPPGTVPHPPLTEFIYTRLGPLLGDTNFRSIPLVFSMLDFILLAFLSYEIFREKRVMFFTLFIYSVSFFSVLASLMVDVDGAVMPFFFLLLSIGYYKFKDSGWKNYKWLILAVLGAVGGFFIKVSAVLPIAAFGLDYAFSHNVLSDRKKVIKYSASAVLGAVVLVLLLFLAKFIFPFFRLEYSFEYWEHFVNFRNFLERGWLQIFIQVVKSLLFASPLLLPPLFYLDRDLIRKTRPFSIFIFLALVFYILLFDFSIGALDRYMQFMIIPLVLVCGSIFEKYISQDLKFNKTIVLSSLVGIIIFATQFLGQSVPALYPKTEWISRVFSFKWNFLYPFFGGSGPFPFYVSFLFIGLVWIFSALFLFVGEKVKLTRKDIVFVIFLFGIIYNCVFIEEYIFGKINGDSKYVAREVLSYIQNNDDVKMVTVYNDNGGWDVQAMGKYRKRLYIDPKFDINEKIRTLNKYKEHYMVIDIPHIDPSTAYAKYFDSCSADFKSTSKYITGYVYDCRKSPDLKI